MTTIHFFKTSDEAYTTSQCDDKIKSGDILIVRSERAVAFLLGGYSPTAVTESFGVFGHIIRGEREVFLKDEETSFEDYVGFEEAEEAAKKRGFKLTDHSPKAVAKAAAQKEDDDAARRAEYAHYGADYGVDRY